MSNETSKHESANGHGSYEHQDLQVSGIFYFLFGLIVVTVLCIFGLRGFYEFLDHRERAAQPAVSPLVTNIPQDTRRVTPGYPQSAFPDPKLEEDERGQLNNIRMKEETQLYSYGWVDENAGTLHIPIERAMDLIVQRGLPVRGLGGTSENAAAATPVSNSEPNKTVTGNKSKK